MKTKITRCDLNKQDFGQSTMDNEQIVIVTTKGIIEMLYKVYKQEVKST